MFPWPIWVILGAFIGIGELHAPGAYLIWVALGAAITAVIEAVYGLSARGQIEIFFVACLISCFLGYCVYRTAGRGWSRGGSEINRRDLAMIGETGIVCMAFVNGYGKVRIGDTVWLAEGPDVTVNTPVNVLSVRGSRLVVGHKEMVRGFRD